MLLCRIIVARVNQSAEGLISVKFNLYTNLECETLRGQIVTLYFQMN